MHPGNHRRHEGKVHIGLDSTQLVQLVHTDEVVKISSRDIAPAIVGQKSGGTTVAGSLAIAVQAWIKVFATGGIGGVHRGAPFDVSADDTQNTVGNTEGIKMEIDSSPDGKTETEKEDGGGMTPEMIWQAALGELQLEITRATFNTWVKPTILLKYADGTWRIGVPNELTREWLQTRLYSTVGRILFGISGRPGKIDFVVNGNH